MSENGIDRIIAIRSSALFRTCSETILKEVAEEFTEVHLAPDQILFREGEMGHCLYIVIRGKLAIYTTDTAGNRVIIDEKHAGACVGEIALLTGQLRTASVCALEETILISLSKEGFTHLARRHPGLAPAISSAILPNMQTGYLARILSDLFGTLEMDVLQELQNQLEWTTLTKGETLFRQGDPGDGMFIVVTGRLQILIQDKHGKEHIHSEVGPGEVVGELALLTRDPRAATVYAIREANVVKLPAEVFEKLISQFPQMMVQISRMIVRRQQSLSRENQSRSYNYVIVPLSQNLPLPDFLPELAHAMSQFGTVLTLNAELFDQIYGVNGAAQTPQTDPLSLVMTKCLTDLAARYKYLIYAADYGWTAWTQRCIEQADRVLLMAYAQAEHKLREVEEEIHKRYDRVRVELVLLHGPQTETPHNTEAWLAPRNLFTHHHIRHKDYKHTRRLARHLTNNKIGLVLSGGGARGFAHVGVIKALHEMGIEIDAVGGTSMGSLISAVYAIKHEPQTILEMVKRFADTRQLFDFTLPIVSLMSSNKVNHVLEELFGETAIEDLWHPFFCVSSNLSRAEPIIHRQGSLRRAVRASVSIPTVFSPVVFNGDVVVDGGIMNNFPVDIMRELCEDGTVLGVTVAPTLDRVRDFAHDDSISGWRMLINRLNPASEKDAAPSLIWTVLRSMEINNVYFQNSMEKLTDLFIHPDVSKFGILEFGSYEPIIQIGYETAAPKLKDWHNSYISRYGRG